MTVFDVNDCPLELALKAVHNQPIHKETNETMKKQPKLFKFLKYNYITSIIGVPKCGTPDNGKEHASAFNGAIDTSILIIFNIFKNINTCRIFA